MPIDSENITLTPYKIDRAVALEVRRFVDDAMILSLNPFLKPEAGKAMFLKATKTAIQKLGISLPESTEEEVEFALRMREAIINTLKVEEKEGVNDVFLSIATDQKGAWQGMAGGHLNNGIIEIEDFMLHPNSPIEALGRRLIQDTKENLGTHEGIYISPTIYDNSPEAYQFLLRAGYGQKADALERVGYFGNIFHIH